MEPRASDLATSLRFYATVLAALPLASAPVPARRSRSEGNEVELVGRPRP